MNMTQPNVGLLLGQRRRRLPNGKPTLGRSLMFAGERVHSIGIKMGRSRLQRKTVYVEMESI